MVSVHPLHFLSRIIGWWERDGVDLVEKQGMCHNVALAIYIKKYLKAKRRRIMETQIFHYHAKILSSKNPLKETPKKSFKILL